MTMPSFGPASTYTPDRLFAGDQVDRVTEEITLLSGENRTRGALLGKQTTDTVPTTGTADGGNTGNGTMGSVAAGGTELQPGVYTIRCIAAAGDAGDFEVRAPDGSLVGIAIVGTAFTSPHLDFTIADGATDFAVGDLFTVTVAGSGKWKLSLAAATDGSQNPRGILVQDTDASLADVEGAAYVRGQFNAGKVTFGTGHTASSVADELRDLGMYLITAQSA